MTSTQTENPEIALTNSLPQKSQVMSSDLPTSPSRSMKNSPMHSSNASIQTVSTATYERQEQEAEDAFNQRIEKLCQDLWPLPTSIKHRFSARLRTNKFFRSFIPSPQIPLIQHLKGGGFNHITSITLPPSYGEGHRNLILRIPRESESRPDQQVATLNFVRQRTSIPVAMVEAMDFSCDNAVRRPYVLQHRIPGIDLDSVWDDLGHLQRCMVAKEVGRLIKTLLSVESPFAGTVEAAANGSSNSAELPNIVPFVLTNARGDLAGEPEPNSIPRARTSRSRKITLEFFEDYLARWRNSALAENLGEIHSDVELYDELIEVVREMDTLGLFKPDLNCLCHLDLHPRNIMVETHSKDSIQVTGILDWDEAVVAPKFVNCQPPGWLWGYDKDTHTENSLLPWPYELEGANITPSTTQQQQLKLIFDENAGPEYSSLAYDESSRLIRGIYRIATQGLTANWFNTAADRIVKEWKLLRPSLVSKP